jgi:hypothetical protein
MEIFKELNKKGYKHYCEGTVEELDDMDRNNPDLHSEIMQVIMWLYEKHGIWINVGGDCDYKFKFEIHTWNWYEHEKTYRLGHIVLGESFFDTSSEPFNSPTEAYESAIEYTLNNLI